MDRTDPLAREAASGLAGAGASQLAYLGYLALQALVVALWWPKGGIDDALRAGGGPDPLLAALIACGIAVTYHAVRCGAEELLLPGQHTLREWVHATELAPWRIVRGYVAGHVLQSLHLVALSAPLVLAAFTVSGGRWPVLAWSVAAIVLQATSYRLAAAATYLAIGHRGDLTFWSVRAIFVGGHALGAAAFPAASHPVVTARLVTNAPAEEEIFLLAYLALGGVLAMLVHHQVRRERAGSRG